MVAPGEERKNPEKTGRQERPYRKDGNYRKANFRPETDDRKSDDKPRYRTGERSGGKTENSESRFTKGYRDSVGRGSDGPRPDRESRENRDRDGRQQRRQPGKSRDNYDRPQRNGRAWGEQVSRNKDDRKSFANSREQHLDSQGRIINPRDLRSANRPDRERSPDIDEGVTGAELAGPVRGQLRTLETRNAEWVAKHLVMAGRLIDEDPELAFKHALAASRRGGRLAAVREAVGLTAYAAGHYAEALRELRTFRRISGSNEHLPLMADSERGMGRPERALELAASEDVAELNLAGQVEMAIVAAGARGDQGQWRAAEAELRIPALDKNRAFSFSPRLFLAYADVLEQLDRPEEAESWRRQAALAEQALSGGEAADIVDLLDDEDTEAADTDNPDNSEKIDDRHKADDAR